MLIPGSRRLLAATLMLALNSYCSASTPVGLIYAKGNVEVDGTHVPDSMTLVNGQAVRVSSNSSAFLNLSKPKTSIFASENTRFEIKSPNELTLFEGGLSINTEQQVKTYLGSCGYVIPYGKDGRTTKYEIELRHNTAFVFAHEMPLTIVSEGTVLQVPAQKIAVVENFPSVKCAVAFYDAPMTTPLKVFLAGAYTAAVAVAIWYPPVSSEHPESKKTSGP